VPAPKAAIGPDGRRLPFKDAGEVSQWLITEKLISTVPWDEAGACLRFSVTFMAQDQSEEQRVLREVASRLAGVRLEF
jgi:LL-diaminopimelate aminotransferase